MGWERPCKIKEKIIPFVYSLALSAVSSMMCDELDSCATLCYSPTFFYSVGIQRISQLTWLPSLWVGVLSLYVYSLDPTICFWAWYTDF